MIDRICAHCGQPYRSYQTLRVKFCGSSCYQAFKVGSNHPNWKGGSYICKGYRYIFAPWHPNRTKIGYVVEHRLVMEKRIGRKLRRNEIVHHLNGDRLDNRISNLELLSSQGAHNRVHDPTRRRDRFGRYSVK